MISCLQEDAQATESYYKWQIARRHLFKSKYDAAQSLGCDVHRTMAGSSFYCGPPSGWKVVETSSRVTKTLAKLKEALDGPR